MFGSDPVGDLQGAVQAVWAMDRSGWDAGARSTALLGLLAARERLVAAIVVLGGEWDARGTGSWMGLAPRSRGSRSAPR